jgi:hypothetical protein
VWDPVALAEGRASEGPLLATYPDLVGGDAAAIVRADQRMSARDYLDAQEGSGTLHHYLARLLPRLQRVAHPEHARQAFELGRLAPSTINGYPIPPAFVSGSGVGFALRA